MNSQELAQLKIYRLTRKEMLLKDGLYQVFCNHHPYDDYYVRIKGNFVFWFNRSLQKCGILNSSFWGNSYSFLSVPLNSCNCQGILSLNHEFRNITL